MDRKFNVKTIILIIPLFLHLLTNDDFQGDFLNKLYISSTFSNMTYRAYHYLFMKSIWQKVGHEQVLHVNIKCLATALKKYVFTIFCFFFLSVHQTTKKILAFIKVTMLLLFPSHALSALIDWLIFKDEQIWLASLNFTYHTIYSLRWLIFI